MEVKLIVYSNLKNYIKGYNDKEDIAKEFSEGKSVRKFLSETIKHERAIDV